MKIAIYTRVSTERQSEEGFSLAVQYERLIEYAKVHGWEVYKVYTDPGVSAKTLKRPGIQELLKDLNKGHFSAIIVHKLDRLTRNISDLYGLVELFIKKEVKLISLTENIDTSSAMGRMFIYLIGVFAQMMRENLAEEVIKGQTKRAENGLRNNSFRPYGYNVLKEDLSLVVDPDESVVVKRIFDNFLAGWGRIKIARDLNDEGIPARGGKLWYESYITNMLTNVTYTGATHWKTRGADESERIIRHGMHEAIISMETFEAVQTALTRRTEAHMSTSSYDFPFSTILKCGDCGRSYHGKAGTYKAVKRNPVRHYRCSGKYRVNPCYASDISEQKLLKLFFDFIDRFALTIKEVDKTIQSKDVDKDIKRLKKAIEDSVTKRKNYTRAMGNGKIDYDTFEELIDEETKKSSAWEEELNRISEYRPAPTTRKDITKVVDNIRDSWDRWSNAERKVAVQSVFEIIIIKKIDGEFKIMNYKLAESQ